MKPEDHIPAWLVELGEVAGDEVVPVAERVFAWAQANGLRHHFTQPGAGGEQYWPFIREIEWEPAPIAMGLTPPDVFLSGELLYKHPPFKSAKKQEKLLERLYAIPAVKRTPMGMYPHIPLADLADPVIWDEFFGAIDWVVQEIRRAAELGLK